MAGIRDLACGRGLHLLEFLRGKISPCCIVLAIMVPVFATQSCTMIAALTKDLGAIVDRYCKAPPGVRSEALRELRDRIDPHRVRIVCAPNSGR